MPAANTIRSSTVIGNVASPPLSDVPNCRCGNALEQFSTRRCGDNEIRVFRCGNCNHELRLAVWGASEDLSQ